MKLKTWKIISHNKVIARSITDIVIFEIFDKFAKQHIACELYDDKNIIRGISV